MTDGGGDGLKQEMTSIPSARQFAIMIKNGKRKRMTAVNMPAQKELRVISQKSNLWYLIKKIT